MRIIQLVCVSAVSIAGAACRGSSTRLGARSAFVSAGRDAEHIDGLFRITVGALLIRVAVVAIAVYTIRFGESHGQRAANLLILGGAVAAPTVVLGALIGDGMPLVPTILAPPEGGPSIRVTAKQWWWLARD